MRQQADQVKKSSSRHQADLQLAQRCLAEDSTAWHELFRSHAAQVYALARRLVGGRAEAEDVVQEVFTQLLSALASYRGEASLSSWLYRITVRCSMRQMKKRKRRRSVPLEVVPERADLQALPDGAAQRRRALRRAREILEQVAASRRAVFLLHEVEGFSLPETAALLGISVTAAKKRVWRARRDIERLIDRDPTLREVLKGGWHV